MIGRYAFPATLRPRVSPRDCLRASLSPPTVAKFIGIMPLKANDRLILVRIKIERAKKHLAEMQAEILANRNRYLHIVISDKPALGFSQMNDDPKQKVPTLPANVIATAGDVVHNLRSALDHLAYQLVVVGTPSVEPHRRIEFPIAKDATTYESTKAVKVEGMRPEAVKAIDALQPYKGGCHGDILWRIHELDNINKHRTHFYVAHDYLLTADWMPSEYLVRIASTPHFTGVEGEDFDVSVQEEMQLEVEKALGDSEIVQGNSLLPALRQMVNFVDDLVSRLLPLLE